MVVLDYPKGNVGGTHYMPSTAYPTWLYRSILPSYRVQPKEIRRFIFFQSFFAQNLIQRRFMVVLDYPKGNFGGTHYYALYSLPNLAVLVNTAFPQGAT